MVLRPTELHVKMLASSSRRPEAGATPEDDSGDVFGRETAGRTDNWAQRLGRVRSNLVAREREYPLRVGLRRRAAREVHAALENSRVAGMDVHKK
jgi:hypothetical protein